MLYIRIYVQCTYITHRATTTNAYYFYAKILCQNHVYKQNMYASIYTAKFPHISSYIFHHIHYLYTFVVKKKTANDTEQFSPNQQKNMLSLTHMRRKLVFCEASFFLLYFTTHRNRPKIHIPCRPKCMNVLCAPQMCSIIIIYIHT